MKLVRYGAPGQERPGLIDAQGKLRDLSAHVGDIDADALVRAGRARLAALDPASLPEVAGTPRYGAPVAHTGKMICVGLNYTDHAAETGAQPPTQPILFMKATNTIMGANDDVIAAAWRSAMYGKKRGHGVNDPDFLQPERPMSAIGG